MALKVLFMKGLPGSGKSTWALARIAAEPGKWARINRDSIREMCGEPFSKDFEKLVATMRDVLIVAALAKGRNVIVDDTNLGEHIQSHIQALLTDFDVEFEVIDLTTVSLAECIERDSKRTRSVGDKVIGRMFRESVSKTVRPKEYDQNKGDCIICDIDGTLARMVGRSPYDETRVFEDELNRAVLEAVIGAHLRGYAVILVSGRHETCREDTEKWLKFFGVPYDALYMRGADDNRNDAIVKKEIYEKHIEPKSNVIFVLDDRDRVVDFWRSIGLSCFQVNYGAF